MRVGGSKNTAKARSSVHGTIMHVVLLKGGLSFSSRSIDVSVGQLTRTDVSKLLTIIYLLPSEHLISPNHIFLFFSPAVPVVLML